MSSSLLATWRMSADSSLRAHAAARAPWRAPRVLLFPCKRASRAACGRLRVAHLGSRTTIFTTSASAGLPSRLCICSTQALTSSTCRHARGVAGPVSLAQPVHTGQWGPERGPPRVTDRY